jgi:hypothetical protein
MPFPIPDAWTQDTRDIRRDEGKRIWSPSSFFYSQSRAFELALQYFRDEQLREEARGGVSKKHRHRIALALFGQLMASFEYLIKDFIGQVIDATDLYDDKLTKCEWIKVDIERVLVARDSETSVGALLIHPTLGWQKSEDVNKRYKFIFQREPIATDEVVTLDRLWILRHTVAHNAGFLTSHDSYRIGVRSLSEKFIHIDDQFFRDTIDFLRVIAERIAVGVGGEVLRAWLKKNSVNGNDYVRDEQVYNFLKALSTYISSRTKELPTWEESDYMADWAAANPS